MSERLPRVVLLVLLVGLALHNLAMALLWQAGARGGALDVVAAWKEALLLVALALALSAAGSVPLDLWSDRLALVYAAIVILYWILPQTWLGGEATTRGELYGLRHHLLPVAGYALGRLLVLDAAWWRRIGLSCVGVACGLTAWGLVDVYLVPLQWWRESGVPGWFSDQLGLVYHCLTGLPENWILNTGDEDNPIRRLVSTFLSPLATAYLLVVVLLLLASVRRRPWVVAVAAVAFCGLLWTHTRAGFIALAVGLAVLGLVQRRRAPVVLAAVSLVGSAGFVEVFPSIGPSSSYTADELVCLRDRAAAEPGGSQDPLSPSDSSTSSHLRNLRDGIETVLRHPQGYGLGNAGVTASRTGVTPQAGESTYTEIGVDAGLAGAVALVAWFVAMLAGLWRRSPWLCASIAAVAALGLQTDVIGIHWIAVVVFALAGAALRRRPGAPGPETSV